MNVRILLMAILFTSCAYGLKPHVPAFERTFRLKVSDPTEYSVRVQGETALKYSVAANGDVHIKVPESPHACDRYLLGKINLGGSGWPHILVLKNNRKISELSPMDLWEQKPDKEGVYELRLD